MSVTVRVVGVMETGEPRGTGVPVDPRKPIRVGRGETLNIRMTVRRSEGPLADLTGGTVSMYVRPRFAGAAPLARLAGTLQPTAGPGRVDITLPGSVTARWRDAQVLYDIAYTDAGGDTYIVTAASPLYLGSSPTLER